MCVVGCQVRQQSDDLAGHVHMFLLAARVHRRRLHTLDAVFEHIALPNGMIARLMARSTDRSIARWSHNCDE